MATFDSMLNAIIPWVIGVIGIFLFYKALKEPLDKLGGLIKRGLSRIGGGGSNGDGRVLTPNDLDYE